MKTLFAFLIIWISATVLLSWLGDYNTYLVYPNGNMVIKERASIAERIIFSAIFAGFYSLVTTGLLWCLDVFGIIHSKTRNE